MGTGILRVVGHDGSWSRTIDEVLYYEVDDDGNLYLFNDEELNGESGLLFLVRAGLWRSVEAIPVPV